MGFVCAVFFHSGGNGNNGLLYLYHWLVCFNWKGGGCKIQKPQAVWMCCFFFFFVFFYARLHTRWLSVRTPVKYHDLSLIDGWIDEERGHRLPFCHHSLFRVSRALGVWMVVVSALHSPAAPAKSAQEGCTHAPCCRWIHTPARLWGFFFSDCCIHRATSQIHTRPLGQQNNSGLCCGRSETTVCLSWNKIKFSSTIFVYL